MHETLRPVDEDQVRDAVRWAAAERKPLALFGADTKKGLGRPCQVEYGLSLAALSGIRLYEPDELVMSAGAGTPMAEIEAALAAENQQLDFEPPDLGPLYGAAPGGATVGGVFASNLAGPRRIRSGAARDHFLGFRAVSGRGEIFKAGGRVVKNVTGYDLSKLMAGSHGTLAALTEVTFKVLPAPEKVRTVLVFGLDERRAVAALAAALNSPNDVSGAAHLPPRAAAVSAVSHVGGAGAAVTAVRVEGFGPSVAHRCRRLRELLAGWGATEELHTANSRTFWREVAEIRLLPEAAERPLWRVSVPPSAGPAVAAAVAETVDTAAFFDWGGGLVWLAVDAAEDAAHGAVRAAAERAGGHATLYRAPDDLRAAVSVFHPQPPALRRITEQVKLGFDPLGILNPGRMYAGV